MVRCQQGIIVRLPPIVVIRVDRWFRLLIAPRVEVTALAASCEHPNENVCQDEPEKDHSKGDVRVFWHVLR